MIGRLQQYASQAAAGGGHGRASASEEALPPLECSQRTVIRSLTAQLAGTQRALQQLGAERDALQDRLRALRGSLGSGHAAEVLIDLQQQEAGDPGLAPGGLFVDAPPGAAAPPPHGGRWQEEPVSHAEGMFALLRHHTKALGRAQEQLGAMLQQQGQGPEAAAGDGELGGASSAVLLPQLAHAAAMLAAELPAMEATIQVFQAETLWLLQRQGANGGSFRACLFCWSTWQRSSPFA